MFVKYCTNHDEKLASREKKKKKKKKIQARTLQLCLDIIR